jgi:hypothetical protein
MKAIRAAAITYSSMDMGKLELGAIVLFEVLASLVQAFLVSSQSTRLPAERSRVKEQVLWMGMALWVGGENIYTLHIFGQLISSYRLAAGLRGNGLGTLPTDMECEHGNKIDMVWSQLNWRLLPCRHPPIMVPRPGAIELLLMYTSVQYQVSMSR